MPPDVTSALAAPYDSPLIFRTEIRTYLYVASAGLALLGSIFVGYAITGRDETGWLAVLAGGMGVAMLYFAWVNFWVTRAGYPHLILLGHRLTVQSSDAFRRDLDLGALGETKIVILTGDKGSQRLYLCFLPADRQPPPRRRFVAARLAPFAETILLNGYVGSNLARAKAVERVIAARRREPKQGIALPEADIGAQRAGRLRLVATAASFAALWLALILWRLLG